MPRRAATWLLALAALAIACMPFYASPYHMQLASTAMIAAMFALSLQLLVGGAGMVSLAQAAFFGLGAYAVHLLGRATGRPPSILLSLPVSAAVAGSPRWRSVRSRCARAASSS